MLGVSSAGSRSRGLPNASQSFLPNAAMSPRGRDSVCLRKAGCGKGRPLKSCLVLIFKNVVILRNRSIL